MAEATVESHIAEFTSRLEKEFSLIKISEIEPEQMAAFNIELYKDEFNAGRYKDIPQILSFWSWKYAKNPASVSQADNHGWVVSYKGRLVGQFHYIPARVKIGDKDYRCAWGSDLAILSQYRSLGVSAFLIQKARQDLGKEFAAFLLGGMNPNSYGVFKNSGFYDIGKIPRYVKVLNYGKLLSSYGLHKGLSSIVGRVIDAISSVRLIAKRNSSDIQIEWCDGFDYAFNDFWGSVKDRYSCIAIRDQKVLGWRYSYGGESRPLWKYGIVRAVRGGKVAAFAVIREGEIKNGKAKGLKMGIITDMLTDPSDGASGIMLIDEVVRYFRKAGAVLIKCDVLGEPIERLLRLSGFCSVKAANGFMLNIYDEGIDPKIVLNRCNWFLDSGDSDLDFD